jgi:hypothetical protein
LAGPKVEAEVKAVVMVPIARKHTIINKDVIFVFIRFIIKELIDKPKVSGIKMEELPIF